MSNNRQGNERSDEQMIQEAIAKGYRRGWEERKEFDTDLIEEALRKSQDYEEFSNTLREKIAREEDRVK